MSDSRKPRGERGAEEWAGVRATLEEYYTRYYRDMLGIPTWRDHVRGRIADETNESGRLTRLEEVVGRSLRGCRLLNVGCGTGGFNCVAEGAGIDAWGIDPDFEALAIAKARASKARIVCAMAESLPFPDKSFDAVYCFSVIEHMRDAERAFYEMVRVLRSDGALYLHTPNRWSCFEGHYKIFWLPGLPQWLGRAYLAARGRPTTLLGTLRPLTLTGCRRLLGQAGARISVVSDRNAERRVSGRLWPLVRLYYRLFRIRPYVELVAVRREDS